MASDQQFPLGVTAVMLPELDFNEQLELCHGLGISHYVYRPRVIPAERRAEPYSNWGNHKFDLTPEGLAAGGAAIKEQVKSSGLVPFCTLPEIDTSTPDQQVELHFLGAAAAGCERIRISPVDYPRQAFDFRDHLDEVVGRYRQLIPMAAQSGLKITIEMHVGNIACSPGLTHEIVSQFDPEQLGVILDLPNLGQQGYLDPALAISMLGSWIDHCHIGGVRRVEAGRDSAGQRLTTHEFCPLVDGDLHIPTWLELLAGLDRPVPLIIEDFTDGVLGADRLRRSTLELRAALDAIGKSGG